MTGYSGAIRLAHKVKDTKETLALLEKVQLTLSLHFRPLETSAFVAMPT